MASYGHMAIIVFIMVCKNVLLCCSKLGHLQKVIWIVQHGWGNPWAKLGNGETVKPPILDGEIMWNLHFWCSTHNFILCLKLLELSPESRGCGRCGTCGPWDPHLEAGATSAHHSAVWDHRDASAIVTCQEVRAVTCPIFVVEIFSCPTKSQNTQHVSSVDIFGFQFQYIYIYIFIHSCTYIYVRMHTHTDPLAIQRGRNPRPLNRTTI